MNYSERMAESDRLIAEFEWQRERDAKRAPYYLAAIVAAVALILTAVWYFAGLIALGFLVGLVVFLVALFITVQLDSPAVAVTIMGVGILPLFAVPLTFLPYVGAIMVSDTAPSYLAGTLGFWGHVWMCLGGLVIAYGVVTWPRAVIGRPVVKPLAEGIPIGWTKLLLVTITLISLVIAAYTLPYGIQALHAGVSIEALPHLALGLVGLRELSFALSRLLWASVPRKPLTTPAKAPKAEEVPEAEEA